MTSSAAPPDRAPTPPRLSIGVDAEQVARFDKFAAGEKPWRHVYSPREAEHLAAQPQAAQAFCFAFCSKEALCKALGEAYNFREFECLYRPGVPEQQFLIAPGLCERQAIGRMTVRFDARFLQERGECLVEVHLLRGRAPCVCNPVRSLWAGAVETDRSGARLESIAVAAVEAERRPIEDAHFSPAEIADLGRRRVQSLAGFLAAKRALSRLWAASASGTAALPREFELGHHASGAPRLVAAPTGIALEEALLSISHTRHWAYALAALGKDLEDEGDLASSLFLT